MSSTRFDIDAVQTALKQLEFDGWLLYDFHGGNPLAQRVLQTDPTAHSSRRFAYYIPASGTPQKLVHCIEDDALDHLPGEKTIYLRWQQWEAGIASMLPKQGRIAMEYSPRCANPYVARVDAGTVELVQSTGVDVESSGDLVQLFESTWDEEQWQMHRSAERLVGEGFHSAWKFIVVQIRERGSVRETEVQSHIMDHFRSSGLVTDHPPIVAVGPNSGLPHYAPQQGNDCEIHAGDYVLIDAWAKLNRPRAVIADYTRVCYLGSDVPQKYAEIFSIVAAARDAAIKFVQNALAAGEAIQGWQVDDACRQVIDKAGYGEYFCHRTGHNIGQETHGNGANMDNLETREQRRVLPRTCFSIEPGIYLDEFGVRSEINVFVDSDNSVHITGDAQSEIHALGAI